MKKTLFMLSLVVVMLGLGMSQAYAVVPVIDGFLGAGEWDNVGYTYYLNVTDPNEVDVVPDSMDIARVTLLQELDAVSGGTETVAGAGNDGVYLLVEVFGTPTTLEDPDLNPASGVPLLSMAGDFFGNGLGDPFNLFVKHSNLAPVDGLDTPVTDSVRWCLGSAVTCFPDAAYISFDLVPGALRDRVPDVYEYFFPTGEFGTPTIPFPSSFIGTITFDNGSAAADDIVVGTLIPEPSTMFLTATGLLGMLGFVKFKFWN